MNGTPVHYVHNAHTHSHAGNIEGIYGECERISENLKQTKQTNFHILQDAEFIP